MVDPTKNVFDDDADFQLRVVHYLEGQLDSIELAGFNRLLREDRSARSAFVQICLTRAGLIEQLKENAECDLSRQHPVEFPLDDSDLPDLNETMVTPAFVPPTDEPAGEEPEFKPTPFVPAKNPEERTPRRVWPFAASILLLLTLGGIIWRIHGTDRSAKNTISSTDGKIAMPDKRTDQQAMRPRVLARAIADKLAEKDLGVLDQAVDAVWSEGRDSARAGSAKLAAGPHNLLHGVVKVSFKDGTSLVIQGPAQFEIESDSKVHLSLGRLCAKVPHNGATLAVTGNDMTAVDLGTEFGMEVVPDKETRLEVFEGHVRGEATDSNGQTATRILSANEAVVSKSGTGSMQDTVATPLAFVREGEMAQLAKSSGSPYRRWLSFSRMLRQDPDLVAYYPFDNRTEMPGELLNRAAATASHHDGKFGNGTVATEVPHWSRGRWEGKDALTFGENGPSAVTFGEPGSLIPSRAITLGIWLKRTENAQAVHLLNGTSGTQTGFNLNLMGTLGKLPQRLYPCTAYFTWARKDVPSAADLPTNDRWYFLAVTEDLHGPTKFYIDGRLVSSDPGAGLAPLPLEKLTLGGPVRANTDADQRDIFRGSADELMIFRRVLSADELQRIYRAGGSY